MAVGYVVEDETATPTPTPGCEGTPSAVLVGPSSQGDDARNLAMSLLDQQRQELTYLRELTKEQK